MRILKQIDRIQAWQVIAIICLMSLSSPVHADDWSIEYAGRYSDLTAVVNLKPVQDEVEILIVNNLRTTIEGEYKDTFEFEIHLVSSMTLSSSNLFDEVPLFGVLSGGDRYRALDLRLDSAGEGNATLETAIDRMNITIELPSADITIGRQAITFGKAYFWNPLDLFGPFNAQQFDRDYKAGVDAIRVDIPTGDFSGFTFVTAAGRKIRYDGVPTGGHRTFATDWYGSAAVARFFTTVNSWDYSFQAGKVYGGYQLGGGLVGEMGATQVRGEISFFNAVDSPEMPMPFSGDLLYDHWLIVAGLGKYYSSTLDLQVEYFFNGGGDPNNLDASFLRMLHGGALQLGRHFLGMMASYELDPLTIARIASIYSHTDPSLQIQPIIVYSVDNNSELLIGAVLNLGKTPSLDTEALKFMKSEFGSYPDFYFLQYKSYF